MDFYTAIFVAIMIAFFIGLYLGFTIARDGWRYVAITEPDHTPNQILNYPVAFYDDEFGVVIDQAEFHPNSAPQWRSVPDGTPCRPFAWFDLPSPPPAPTQHTVPSRRINDYI